MVKRLPFAFGLIAAIVIGCLSNQGPVINSATEDEFSNIVVSRRVLTARGGRVDWCASNNLIAFDRMTGKDSSEVFVIRPDGSEERCITCNMPDLPGGIRGQPAWHPSGKFYKGGHFEFVSWEEHGEPSPTGSLVTFNSSRSYDWKNPPDTAKTLRLELWARETRTGKVFRLTDFNKQSANQDRVLTSDYAWSPSGREIAVYYATFGRNSITQKVDILRLDRAY